jgi:hypothetical protein
MRRSIINAFDEVISLSTNSGVAYTSTALNDRLGGSDEISVFCVVDNAQGSGTGTFDLWIEHSGDGRNWLQVRDTTWTSPPTYSAGSGDISIGSLSSSQTYVRAAAFRPSGATNMGGSNWQGPLLPYVRIAMKLGTYNSVHVKLHVTGRGP